jgi:hypothetical protein
MALTAHLDDKQSQSFVELGSSGVPARRVVLYDASGNALAWAPVAAAADGMANPTTAPELAFEMGWNGTTWDRVFHMPANQGMGTFGSRGIRPTLVCAGRNPGEVVALSTGDSSNQGDPRYNLSVLPGLWNGSSLDRAGANQQGTALALAARTTATNSADLTNGNHRGVLAFLNVTAASGTGGLTLSVKGKDPVSGSYAALVTATAAVTATGLYVYGAGAGWPNGASFEGVTLSRPVPPPRTFRVEIAVGDASSYTYSVGYALVV